MTIKHKSITRKLGLAATVLTCVVATVSCEKSSAPPKNSDAAPVAPAETQKPTIASTTPGFEDITTTSGIAFTHYNGATAEKFFPEIMGSGGAFLDYDNDGDLDVLLIQSGPINATTQPLFETENFENHVALFRNDLGDAGPQFVDVTKQSNLKLSTYGMGVATGDVNGDGYLDVYLTDLSANAFYLNNGDGTFTEAPSGISPDDRGWFTSASFLDFDLDGNLDLFITRYVDVDLENARSCFSNDGQRDYCTPDIYKPQTDILLRGDGTGKLSNVEKWHVGPPAPRTGLGVVAADYDNDGWIDLYVANDKKANQLWMNLGNGTFEEKALMSGSAYNANGKAEASMGVTSGDVDADGDEDLFITHLKGESNTIYLNQGNALFIDSTVGLRLSSTSLPSTGFGTGWFDPDNDGDLDLFTANGAVMIERSQIGTQPFPYVQANQLFEHTPGMHFIDASMQAGFATEIPEVSRGTAFGDIDNDGDIDLLVTNNNGPARLLRNQLNSDNHWLSVTAVGTTSNKDAAGARIGLERSGQPILWRRVGTDGSYLSANDRRVHFGLGSDQTIDGLLVRWPNNVVERFEAPSSNQFITIIEGEGLDDSSTN